MLPVHILFGMAASHPNTGSRIAAPLPALLLLLAAIAASAQAASTPENRTGEKSAQSSKPLLSQTPQTPGLRWEKALTRRYDTSGDSFAPKNALLEPVAGTTPKINPGYPGPGRTQNCVNCTIATDSTFAGTPASAMPSARALPIRLVSEARGGKWFAIEDRSLIEHVMAELGPGARGVVYGNRGTSAHVFNVVVDSKGVVKFFDGQTMKEAVWNGFKEFKLLITNAPN